MAGEGFVPEHDLGARAIEISASNVGHRRVVCRSLAAAMSGPSTERQSVVRNVEDALAGVKDGAVIGVGGSITADHPMALVRGLIRKRLSNLTVVAPTGGLDVDLLIATGCVRRIITAYVGAETIAPVGPAFRASVEAGTIEVVDLDEGLCVQGLRAAAQQLPFLPWRGGLGTSLPELNAELVEFTDPIGGQPLLAVPAVELDYALVHAQRSDPYGNIQFSGTGHMDPLLAAAAREVIVQVHQVVGTDRIRADPGATRFWRDTIVVHAPWGTHPFASTELALDEDALRAYVAVAKAAAAGDDSDLDAYLQQVSHGSPEHADYLEQVGIRRLIGLLGEK